jgi:nitroimidazol reductase NimA-like FMN-containing flavoprotein (pyridoxamine 5'-phosphate oxidase superfamily)
MSDAEAQAFLAQAFSIRLASVGPDGWPYVIPLLFVVNDGEVLVHTTSADGHFRTNVLHQPNVCIEADEPGTVYGYGRTQCETTLSYRSVVAFGRIREMEDRESKERFCTALMRKYASHIEGRENGAFPRLDHIRVYAIAIERMTGKQAKLPVQRA